MDYMFEQNCQKCGQGRIMPLVGGVCKICGCTKFRTVKKLPQFEESEKNREDSLLGIPETLYN